jgi:hypothetical protein
MDLDVKSAVGEIIPDVTLSRVILESAAQEIYQDNPHIEAEGDVKIPYNQASVKPLKVTIDIKMKDIVNNDMLSTWATNFDFNKYLRVEVIQVREASVASNLFQKLSLGKKNFLDRLQLYKKENTISPNDLFLIDLRQDQIANNTARVLTEKKYVNSTGQEILEFGFTVVFGGMPSDKPDFLQYYAFSYLDLQELSNDFGLDLADWTTDANAVPEDFILESMGSVKTLGVIRNGSLLNSASYYTRQDGTVWTGQIFTQEDGTFSGQPNGDISLTAVPVQNTKIQDFRARDRYLEAPIDMNFLDQKFFAPLTKMKISGADDIVPSIKPAYFSDIMVTTDWEGNNQLFFTADMETLFRYNSKFGSFTNAFIGNPLKEMLALSSIQTIKVFKRRVRLDSSERDPFSGKTIYKPEDPNDNPDLIAFGSFVISKGKIAFLDLEESKKQKQFIYCGEEITNVSLSNKNVKNFTLTDLHKANGSLEKPSFQYHIEFEFIDGGYAYFLQIYQDILFEYSFLDMYSTAAQIPKAFDHKTKTFSADFKQKYQGVYLDHITNLISRVTQLGAAVAASGPENNSFNYVELSNLLANYVNPQSGTITGIEAFKTMVLEALYNLERILDLKSQKPKSTAQEPSEPNGATGQRRINVTSYFGNVLSPTDKHFGYDFLSVDKSDATQNIPTGLTVVESPAFDLRLNKEVEKYFKPDTTEFDIEFNGKESLINLESYKHSYLTPGYVFLKDTDPNSLTIENISSLQSLQFLELATKLILRKKNINGPQAEFNLDNLKALLAEKGAMLKAKTLGKYVPEEQPIANDLGKDVEDLDENWDSDVKDQQAGEDLQQAMESLIASLNSLEALNTMMADEGDATSSSFSLNKYLLSSPDNAFAKLGTLRPADHMRKLPNQIKSLFLAGEAGAETTNDDLKFNPFTEGNPMMNVVKSFFFFFYYQNIVRVEYLDRYQMSADGKNRNFVSKPEFQLLTQAAYESLRGKTVLCRLVRHTDSLFIKPFKSNFMELPFMNEFFLLNINNQSPAAVMDQAEAPTVYETAKATANAAGQAVTPDVIQTADPEPTDTTPPLPSAGNRAGGGY